MRASPVTGRWRTRPVLLAAAAVLTATASAVAPMAHAASAPARASQPGQPPLHAPRLHAHEVSPDPDLVLYLPDCPTEDATGPCFWDATARGNHRGESFWVDWSGQPEYDIPANQ